MLELTRKPDQSIRIGNDIEIHVLEVRGQTVRLGIHAASDIPVYRSELLTEVQQTNGHSANVAPNQVRRAGTLLSQRTMRDKR